MTISHDKRPGVLLSVRTLSPLSTGMGLSGARDSLAGEGTHACILAGMPCYKSQDAFHLTLIACSITPTSFNP